MRKKRMPHLKLQLHLCMFDEHVHQKMWTTYNSFQWWIIPALKWNFQMSNQCKWKVKTPIAGDCMKNDGSGSQEAGHAEWTTQNRSSVTFCALQLSEISFRSSVRSMKILAWAPPRSTSLVQSYPTQSIDRQRLRVTRHWLTQTKLPFHHRLVLVGD